MKIADRMMIWTIPLLVPLGVLRATIPFSEACPSGLMAAVQRNEANVRPLQTRRGVYFSADNGTSWTPGSPGMPVGARVDALAVSRKDLVAGTEENGAYLRTATGARWVEINRGLPPRTRITALVAKGDDVFAGTSRHGVLVFSRTEETWTAANTGLTDRCIRSLAVKGTQLFAGTDRHGVFASRHHGRSWKPMNKGLPARIQVHALAVSGPRVFAGLYSKGIYVSSDGGANWKRAGEVHPYSLAVGNRAVYAGHVPGGVFVTRDHGESWREATAGLPEQCVVYALLSVGKSLFAGTLGEAGVYRSTDGGRSWKPARRGLPSDASVISLAACGRLLVAATEDTRRHGAGRPDRDASYDQQAYSVGSVNEMSHTLWDNASFGELAEAADANLVVHASWVLERTRGMRVSDELGVVLADSGLPCDTFNLACRARLTAEQAPRRIREAIAFFRTVGRPFTWWVGPADQPPDLGDLLVDAGLLPAESELAMAADLSALRAYDVSPGGLEIRRVRTAAELRDFARIVAANWTPPDPEVLRFYDLAAPVLLTPDSPQWFYVGYLAGQPVATAELALGGGVVGLYSICTLAAYRRKGIGTALTLQPLLDARDNGFQTSVLQASADGAGVYARIGFKRFGAITEYKPPDRSTASV